MTGAGKSSFVKTLTDSDVAVGHGIESCTTTLTGRSFQHGKYVINLIDTPGFNDTNNSDTDTLKELSIWLNLTYRADVKLTGIIYLHRISDNRISGSAILNLNMLKRLCGDDCLPNVILATTMWSEPTETQQFTAQEDREAELKNKSKFWGDLIEKGTTTTRYDGTYASALSIISDLEKRPRITLDIQRQMVDEGCTLIQTTAGRYLNEGLLEKEKELRCQLDVVRTQMVIFQHEEDEVFARDVEMQITGITIKLAQADKQRRSLGVDIESKLKERDELIQKLAQQTNSSWLRTAAVGAANGLGVLGPAALAIAGLITGTTPIVRALKLGFGVLKLIFEAVGFCLHSR
ncbi:MAG: hypothetical protein MMC33_006511 [Icmadophila ericetorum]|nr:hypothetical protein [Icmadophila ericetorum]